MNCLYCFLFGVVIGEAVASEPVLPKPDRNISLSRVKQTLTAYEHNPFVQFLEYIFDPEVTRQVVKQFWLGTARNSGTVFWHADKEGLFRRPKVMYYGLDGRRIKDQPAKQMHYAGYTLEKGYPLPLFGEHQLSPELYPLDTPIILVESEKTACIGYACLPQYIWMASGGSTALNPSRASVLCDRNVLLLPDADTPGRKGAGRALAMLQKAGAKALVKELFPGREDHSDIADHFIALFQRKTSGERLLPLVYPLSIEQTEQVQRLFNKYPLLWELTDALGLEITQVKNYR